MSAAPLDAAVVPAGARPRPDYTAVREAARAKRDQWHRLDLAPLSNRHAHQRAADVRRGRTGSGWAPRGDWTACVARRDDGAWDVLVRFVGVSA